RASAIVRILRRTRRDRVEMAADNRGSAHDPRRWQPVFGINENRGLVMDVLAVMVRYQTPFSDSQTLQGWCRALRARPELAETYRLLIWDNSPSKLNDPKLPVSF